ncbi:MAG: CDGSH iron-sulfur domain-containing protein [Nitrosopumilaceae archaeon]
MSRLLTKDISRKALSLHRKLKGKIMVESKIRNLTPHDIQLIYTPGVAAVSEEIFHHPNQEYLLTSKASNVAIVTDGTQYEKRNRVTLCRCGASSNKPFCNGSHASIKFNDGML